jgi:arginyl-tRNA synthetase
MTNPQEQLTLLFRQAVAAVGDDFADTDLAVSLSTFADFQVNAALALGNRLKRSPRDVAGSIVHHIPSNDVIERIEVAGPGFINVWFSAGYLSREIARMAADDNLGLSARAASDVVVIDYSSPNVAKEMHVGHLRSTIIGDALARVLESLGDRVIRQNHLGDWGTPFGMLIEHLIDLGAEASEHSITDLGVFYRAARQKFDTVADFAQRSRLRVVKLQTGDEPTLAMWRYLVAASKRHFAAVYALLGITLGENDVAGESFYNPMLDNITAELVERGIAVESQGSLCAFPPGFHGRDGQPSPLIIRKQDGGHGYAATDLCALRYRVHTLGASRILYVVGAPQSQHLAMVFNTAELAGWLGPPVRAEHVKFGSVLGADNKMFKARAGESVRLIDLLEEAIRRALEIVTNKNPQLPADERLAVARAVGIGAVKYGDLATDRVKDYVFDWKRLLAFDGNTAPYLQYAHARARAILRKAQTESPELSRIKLNVPAERSLALRLLTFPTAVAEVAQSLAPHKLCNFLYELATDFSRFFESCPVVQAPSDTERQSRLALTFHTARVLARGLNLLGIESPARM